MNDLSNAISTARFSINSAFELALATPGADDIVDELMSALDHLRIAKNYCEAPGE